MRINVGDVNYGCDAFLYPISRQISLALPSVSCVPAAAVLCAGWCLFTTVHPEPALSVCWCVCFPGCCEACPSDCFWGKSGF